MRSECDAIAPFSRRVYNLYAQYHAGLARKGGAYANNEAESNGAGAGSRSSRQRLRKSGSKRR